jgi:hypothetical protein
VTARTGEETKELFPSLFRGALLWLGFLRSVSELRLPRATGTRPVELERGKKLAPWPVARHGRSCVIFLGKKSLPSAFSFSSIQKIYVSLY